MPFPPDVPRPEPRSALPLRVVTLVGSLVVGLLALACEQAVLPTAPHDAAGARALTTSTHPPASVDYAVYDAVLDSLFGVRTPGGPAPLFVVDDSTFATGDSDLDSHYVRDQFGAHDLALVEASRADFRARTARVALDASAFHAHGRVVFLEESAIPPLAPGKTAYDYWAAFYARYPGARGSINFSRPGYDASGTHALLAYGHGCGGLCGDSGWLLLERRGDRWVLLRQVVTVVS